MVLEALGILGIATTVPTIIGINEATKGTQDHEEERKETARKSRCHLLSTCELTAAPGKYREQIHGAHIVLRDGFMYLEKPIKEESHPFTGAYHAHTDFAPNNTSGMVTTVGLDPPLLRWVFVDSKTSEVRYGGKADSEGHMLGPWSWTDDENNVTLEGWEGFLAIWVPSDKVWKLYFNYNDNGCGLPKGT